jgi:acid phosphatase (class A)
MKRSLICLALLATASLSQAKTLVAPPAAPPAKAVWRLGTGYLDPAKLPDSIALIPPPPASGSAAQARDDTAAQAAIALRGSARWDQAILDAELFKPEATGALSCAAGIVIGPTETPALDHLLRRAFADLGRATGAAKAKYMRQRPFMVNHQPDCTPDSEPGLRRDGSYPSGHSATGYGWGLILAELIPARATQLVARGRAFGDSRRICNVHWLSDTEEGRVVASAVVAQQHSAPDFAGDLAAAKREVATAGPPKRDCAKEAAALAMTP